MAKVTITLEDRGTGQVAAAVEFDPSLKADVEYTNAQTDAFDMLEAVFSADDLTSINDE